MQKRLLFLLSGLLAAPTTQACPWCRPKVQTGIYTLAYSANVLLVLLPIVVLVVGIAVFYWDKLRAAVATAYVAA